jgi:spermidine synthase
VGARGTTGARNAFVPAVVGAAVVAIAVIFVQLDPSKMVSGVFRHGVMAMSPTDKLVFYGHGKTASISLVDRAGHVSIATNGKPDAEINMKGSEAADDEITMVLAGAMPIALHANPRRVANIGIGSGLTSHVVLGSTEVQALDTIEIEPMMAHAARLGFMPHVARTFEDPRSRIVFEDAKTYFAAHRKKYDVIVSEPSNPWVSGVSSLFSNEFYSQIIRYLEEDGMLVQWIQTYEADLDIVLSIMKALEPHFSDFAIYTPDNSNILIVATRRGSIGLPDAKVFSSSPLRAELARVGVRDIADIQARYLGNRELLLPLLRSSGVPANSDYFPFVDLNAARARILRRHAAEFNGIQAMPVPFFALLQPARMEIAYRGISSTVSNQPPLLCVRGSPRCTSWRRPLSLERGQTIRTKPGIRWRQHRADGCSRATIWSGSAFFAPPPSAIPRRWRPSGRG